jgi:transposase-like protein
MDCPLCNNGKMREKVNDEGQQYYFCENCDYWCWKEKTKQTRLLL